jgi:cytochrome c-type biogenesis protein CcmH/NrfG
MLSWNDHLIKQAQIEDAYLEANKERLLSLAARQRRGSRLETGMRVGRAVFVVFISLVILTIALTYVIL